MSELFNLSSWLLDRHVESGRGGRVAMRAQGRSLSYAELLAETVAAASALRELGLRRDERVVLALRDSVELVATFLGAIRGRVARPPGDRPQATARDHFSLHLVGPSSASA